MGRGADAILYFQWRQSRGGAEKFHSAMLPHAGPDSRVHAEIRELGAELAELAAVTGSRSAAEVPLVMEWPSWWGLELDSHPSTELPLLDRVHDHYAPLWEANVLADVVAPGGAVHVVYESPGEPRRDVAGPVAAALGRHGFHTAVVPGAGGRLLCITGRRP